MLASTLEVVRSPYLQIPRHANFGDHAGRFVAKTGSFDAI
ncbi:hypothetical protein BURMUCGD2_5669 [Burkholderia multivorans CGD2]|jgi:hypothetical protein|uniref:Uncharacterized protein n=1 Tax=Burkholderia multivorans CGD2 TaxID=513052 RepID=B9BKR2_9BURK|nr:hypothetical protein BURMUCGD2_5669 [Burkholderia multivorans CGD2]